MLDAQGVLVYTDFGGDASERYAGSVPTEVRADLARRW